MKIKEEELKPLQEQEQKKSAIFHDLGVLDTQRHSLLHIFADLVGEQQKLKTTLEEKYGKINVDLKDGSFKKIEDK